jgi:hypothetical protein
MKVWVCISGSYSDKGVAAVFSKESDAERACRLFDWDSEEFELDEQGPHVWPEGKRPFRLSAATRSGYTNALPHCSADQSEYATPIETTWKVNERDGMRWATGSMWAADKGEADLEANRKLQELLK